AAHPRSGRHGRRPAARLPRRAGRAGRDRRAARAGARPGPHPLARGAHARRGAPADRAAAALAIVEQQRRRGGPLSRVSLVLLELGGAFTAAVAVAEGRIVDGVGGSAGPLGFRAAGALDGEVAYLAGEVSKAMLFRGGAADVAGWDERAAAAERLAHPAGRRSKWPARRWSRARSGRLSPWRSPCPPRRSSCCRGGSPA